MLCSNCRDEARPHRQRLYRDRFFRGCVRKLHDDVESRQHRPIDTKSLPQHPLDTVAVDCAFQLSFTHDETKSRAFLVVRSRVKTKAATAEMDSSTRENPVELFFAREPIVATKSLDC